MEFNDVLTEAVGNSPLLAFLIWYIISERKMRSIEKEKCVAFEKELREGESERQKGYTEILLKNHDVLRDNQRLIEGITQKYDDLKTEVHDGFVNVNNELKDIYKSCILKDEGVKDDKNK